ncbi:hypothetical protein QCN29_24720 [Streptomyces sp. HNM0663]|uniref:Uncharacterized protein n=1 Tax=Streptomyces chengmaiensis TaxID=3040919 RepID=A0ABT6HVQ9_9ACTN|nr:hypothetical protein [Streptomyces chengmaiensis]MDH2391924.1 hypothetical protein [Streptomyces chengmaiensis]
MLPEALTALAAAGGAAVVQAAGSDAWEGLRDRLARWFGRGDAERERGELERLEGSAADLAAAGSGTAEQVRARQEAVWQTRIETLLEGLGDEEQRTEAAAELRQLLEEAAPAAAGGVGLVSGNTFTGPTAFQAGNHNKQDVRFGPQS